MDTVKLKPKASYLIESLRDIGYTFESAVADIIDNSITANAKNINIDYKLENNQFTITLEDDGIGMSKEELIVAMTPGSKSPLDIRSSEDLGRFGLGLKTASFSQCRKLTVLSKKIDSINAACWDLDYVAITEDWDLKLLDISNLDTTINSESGTKVIWENTDRIVDCNENGIIDINEVYEKIDSLQKHLELVFHRFLNGRDKINIYIRNKPLEPFDPFFSASMKTNEMPEETIVINESKILIKPYTLPHYSKVSALEYEKNAGDGGYLKNQGFYVYRNKRLLISGTWFRIIPQSEFYKLARIQIDLPNNLDEDWKIDVKKSMASPPLAIRKRLKKIIDKIAGSSKNVFDKKGHRSSKLTNSFWERKSYDGKINYEINREHPLIKDFSKDLNDTQNADFKELLTMIAQYFPKDTLFADLGNYNPTDVNENSIDDDKIEKLAFNVIEKEREFLNKKEFIQYFEQTEPFRNYTKDWNVFLSSNGVCNE